MPLVNTLIITHPTKETDEQVVNRHKILGVI